MSSVTSFINDSILSDTSWQALERLVARLLTERGFTYVAVIGESGDGGADVLAVHPSGKRWLVQVKRWNSPVGAEVLDRTIDAAHTYGADVPVIVSKTGFTADLRKRADLLRSDGINVQLWDRKSLASFVDTLGDEALVERQPGRFRKRTYQEDAVLKTVGEWDENPAGSALVVLATGLGKTFVAGESVRRLFALKPNLRVLVLAHTNDLIYQLERSFWPFIGARRSTVVVNGVERPEWRRLGSFDMVFATRDSMSSASQESVGLPLFDVVIVDECHHLGAKSYETLLDGLGVGEVDGPFLIGLTATPWRPDGESLDHRFGPPVVSVDMVAGLKHGFLANVDYRMFTDNVDWEALRALKGDRFSPKKINRTLFINEWDDGVVDRLQEVWNELAASEPGLPKAIVFCGTINHAERISERISALGFTRAEAIHSRSTSGAAMNPIERNRMLWDFADGRIGVLCAVDVLNEGVDVPDVNLVVFQRVTHSRRIFVQQLGRGLRLAPGKTKVIVLDFVSDVRRFAAGIELGRALDEDGPAPGNPWRVNLKSGVTFRRANEADEAGSAFLREWLGDLQEIEDADEDVSVLRFPPLTTLPATSGESS